MTIIGTQIIIIILLGVKDANTIMNIGESMGTENTCVKWAKNKVD